MENKFAFSFSTREMHEACPRKLWLKKIGSWKGWEPDAPPRTQLLYRLGKMQGLFGFAGSLVHGAIAREVRSGSRTLIEKVVKSARQKMVTAWNESLNKKWGRKPQKYQKHPAGIFTCFEEHYYGGDADGLSKRAWTRAEASLIHAWNGKVFDDAIGAEVLAADDLPKGEGGGPRLVVDGIPVWVMIDLAYRHQDRVRIIDWKTGKPSGRRDTVQMLLYCLYALDVWGVPLEQIDANVVYLGGEHTPLLVEPEPDAIESLRVAIPEAANEIKERLPNPDMFEAPEENFERTANAGECARCALFHGCYGHLDQSSPEPAKNPDWEKELARCGATSNKTT